MARINVEDSLFTDARYEILAEKHGRYVATGMIIHAWKTAQKYFLAEQKLIPLAIWDMMGLQPLEDCGLAERCDDGIYVKGTRDQFEWLKNKQIAGQKSAMIRAQKKSTLPQQDSTPVEHSGNRNQPLTLTLTPTLTLTQNSNLSGDRASARSRTVKGAQNSSKVWDAYEMGMRQVFGTSPPRNAKTNSLCKKLVEYLGEDMAVKVARIYPGFPNQLYQGSAYPLDLLVRDHAKLCIAYKQKFGYDEKTITCTEINHE